MKITTQLDETYASKLAYIQQRSGLTVADVLSQAIDLYYQHLTNSNNSLSLELSDESQARLVYVQQKTDQPDLKTVIEAAIALPLRTEEKSI